VQLKAPRGRPLIPTTVDGRTPEMAREVCGADGPQTGSYSRSTITFGCRAREANKSNAIAPNNQQSPIEQPNRRQAVVHIVNDKELADNRNELAYSALC